MFWQFWLFFVFKFVVVLVLFVRRSKVYLPIPPSWPEVRNLTFCDSVGGSGFYYAKLNKSVRERQIPYDLTYMWNLMYIIY